MSFRTPDRDETLRVLREENDRLRTDLSRARGRIPALHWALFGMTVASGLLALGVAFRRTTRALAPVEIAWVVFASIVFYYGNRKGPPA